MPLYQTKLIKIKIIFGANHAFFINNKMIKSISKKWNQIEIKLNCKYKNPPKVKTIVIQGTLGTNITDDKAIEIIVKEVELDRITLIMGKRTEIGLIPTESPFQIMIIREIDKNNFWKYFID